MSGALHAAKERASIKSAGLWRAMKPTSIDGRLQNLCFGRHYWKARLLSNDDVSGNQPLLVVICQDNCVNLRKTRNPFTSLEVDPLSVLHLDLDYRCFGIKWLEMLKRALWTKMPRLDDFKPFHPEGLALFARWQVTHSPKPSTISNATAGLDVLTSAFPGA